MGAAQRQPGGVLLLSPRQEDRRGELDVTPGPASGRAAPAGTQGPVDPTLSFMLRCHDLQIHVIFFLNSIFYFHRLILACGLSGD